MPDTTDGAQIKKEKTEIPKPYSEGGGIHPLGSLNGLMKM